MKKYTAVALWWMRVHELKNLAKEVGVKTPAAKTKADLIKEILLIQDGWQKSISTGCSQSKDTVD